MLNKILQFIALIIIFTALPANAQIEVEQVSGRILLQVQSHGEAWYVNPVDLKKYFLGSPNDAFNLMKIFSVGISNENLSKIPVGLTDYSATDSDGDGLADNLEISLGLDANKADTDGDGYDDKKEILNNYNPKGSGKLPLDLNFAKINTGKIFLQVESRGECWYFNPADNKRYFLSKPSEALSVMGQLGLGITNTDLEKIATGYFYSQTATPTAPAPTPISTCTNCQTGNTSASPIYSAAAAIRDNNANQAASHFIKNMDQIIKYTMNFLTAEGRLAWSQMLSGSSLISTTSTTKTYRNYVYFQGEKIEIKYYVKKQADGGWLITNL